VAYLDDYAASLDPRVQNQVKAAFYNFASGVVGNASPPADQAQRVTLATNVLNGNVNWESLILGVCAFAHLTAGSSDTTVGNAVAAMWSAFAGG
jgi:hypothetical protein